MTLLSSTIIILLSSISAAVQAVCPPDYDAATRDPTNAANEVDLLNAISALSGHINPSTTYDPTTIKSKYLNTTVMVLIFTLQYLHFISRASRRYIFIT